MARIRRIVDTIYIIQTVWIKNNILLSYDKSCAFNRYVKKCRIII